MLGFIVADRWMHNQYGASLRRLVANDYAVDAVIEMHDVDAFEDEVSAYPAVTIIRRGAQRSAVVATTDSRFGPDTAEMFRKWAGSGRTRSITRAGFRAARTNGWFDGDETGTRVGIGVATGADSIYVTRDEDLVEHDRMLPLVTSGDISSGTVRWSGTYLVNPWTDADLVELDAFPRLAEYLHRNEHALRRRHIAEKRPSTWYRTIDRVSPTLLETPKLAAPRHQGGESSCAR